MINIDIPGFGKFNCEYLVSDFTGTLSVDGKLLPEVKERLIKISKILKVHIITADTFKTTEKELKGINCEIKIISGNNLDIQKKEYIRKLGHEKVITIGNGKNDRLMLKIARIGIAICLAEDCSIDAIMSSNILVKSPYDAFGLLLFPNRLIACLSF